MACAGVVVSGVEIGVPARFRLGVRLCLIIDEMAAEACARSETLAARAPIISRIARHARSQGLLSLIVGLIVLVAGTDLVPWNNSHAPVLATSLTGILIVLRAIGQISDAGRFDHERDS